MSLATTLTLKDSANVNETFIKINADGTKANYVESAASLQEPLTLQIGHQMTTSREGSDRHMAKVAETVLDTEGKPHTTVWTITGSVPRVGVSSAVCLDNVARLKALLTPEFVAQMLRGEL